MPRRIRRYGPCIGLSVAVFIVLTTTGLLPNLSLAQPFENPNSTSYQRGEAVVMRASSRFTTTNLGDSYRLDLLGMKGRPVVRDTVITETSTDTGLWMRRRTNHFTLNVGASAVGMVDRTLPADTPRRIFGVTLYRLDRVERIDVSPLDNVNAGQDQGLLLTRLYYGWALNLSIVGTQDTFTPEAVAAVQQAFQEKTPIEPVLQRYDLKVAASSRGLVTKVPWTAVPDEIPLDWSAVAEQYPLKAPEPVFAEYTLLRDVRPAPIPW